MSDELRDMPDFMDDPRYQKPRELAAQTGSAVHYHTYAPTDTSKGTQVCLGREVLGFIWHLKNGFKWVHSPKLYGDVQSAKIAIVRSALKHSQKKTAELLIELGRLNTEPTARESASGARPATG
jgi:hypothetical protein